MKTLGCYNELSMKELFKNVIGCFQLHKDVAPRAMQVNVYSSLICFREVTREATLNPMDYIFSIKPLTSLTTKNGFYLYLKIHNICMVDSVTRLFKGAIDITYQVSEAISGNEEALMSTLKPKVRQLHGEIDEFVLGMPPEIKPEVDKLTQQLIENASLTNRMKNVLLIQDD